MQLINDPTLKKILLDGSYVSEADMQKAEEFANTHRTSFIEYFMGAGLLSKDLLGQAIAESYNIPYSDLNTKQVSSEQVQAIPEEIAKKFRVVLFSQDATKVVIATDNPTQPDLEQNLQQGFPDATIVITYSLPEDIDATFVHYQKPLETRFSKIIKKNTRIAPELLEEIFLDALSYHASDIHFEPQSNEVVIRFRVDGVLREAGRIPQEYYENILNRIKVQSRLRIDEHFSAQDGSMRFEKEGHSADMRTSIVPTVEGEKVVLRVLASYVQGLTLTDLGLSAPHQHILEETAEKPFGMILVTGPTGSGKTTTLYALLKLLNKPDINITTIEDPVEYKMRGINQIQVNPQTNLTFAKGLRSIVRQDPDIILIGEIRDEETAEIAVNAALTGHLLLSTFHANDAATAIPRLLDMQIEPFLLASTLQIVVAQRLARKLCDHCRYSVMMDVNDIKASSEIKRFFGSGSITLYQAKGCEICGFTGYKGITAIFEFVRVTPELQELILKNPSTKEIWQIARSQGSESLFEDGIAKVKNGITTIEEVLRVAEPPLERTCRVEDAS